MLWQSRLCEKPTASPPREAERRTSLRIQSPANRRTQAIMDDVVGLTTEDLTSEDLEDVGDRAEVEDERVAVVTHAYIAPGTAYAGPAPSDLANEPEQRPLDSVDPAVDLTPAAAAAAATVLLPPAPKRNRAEQMDPAALVASAAHLGKCGSSRVEDERHRKYRKILAHLNSGQLGAAAVGAGTSAAAAAAAAAARSGPEVALSDDPSSLMRAASAGPGPDSACAAAGCSSGQQIHRTGAAAAAAAAAAANPSAFRPDKQRFKNDRSTALLNSTTAAPRVSKRAAAAAANQAIRRAADDTEDDTEDDTDDDSDNSVLETPAACCSNARCSVAKPAAGKRVKSTAATQPLQTLPHQAVRLMQEKYGSSYRLDLQLQKDRAALAFEVIAALDASSRTQGIYRPAVATRLSKLTDAALATAPMLGKTVTYTPPVDAKTGLKSNCLNGKIVNGRRKIQCLGCDKVLTLNKFEKDAGFARKHASDYIVIDVIDLSIKRFVHLLSSSPDLHESVCVYCREGTNEEVAICSACPAAVHPSCYAAWAGQTVGNGETWQCGSCNVAAECAAAGCSWCEQHGTAQNTVKVHGTWQEYKKTLTTGVAATLEQVDQGNEGEASSEADATVTASATASAGDAAPGPAEALQAAADTSAPASGSDHAEMAPANSAPAGEGLAEAEPAGDVTPVAVAAPAAVEHTVSGIGDGGTSVGGTGIGVRGTGVEATAVGGTVVEATAVGGICNGGMGDGGTAVGGTAVGGIGEGGSGVCGTADGGTSGGGTGGGITSDGGTGVRGTGVGGTGNGGTGVRGTGVGGTGDGSAASVMSSANLIAVFKMANEVLAAVRKGASGNSAILTSCGAASKNVMSLAIQLGLRGRDGDPQLGNAQLEQKMQWIAICNGQLTVYHEELKKFPEGISDQWKEDVLRLLTDM